MFGMKSLQRMQLSTNNLSGTFTVAGPSPNLTYLSLSTNKLTGFVGGGILTNLQDLFLQNNEFQGDFIITAENFPDSIERLFFSFNPGLESIDAESKNAVPKLSYLDVSNIKDIAVKSELCDRQALFIDPSNACA